MRTGHLVLPALLLTAVLVAGCGDDSGPLATDGAGLDDYVTMDFSDPTGGLTVSDEAAAFADPALEFLLLTDDEQAVADPLADDPLVRTLEAAGELAADPADSTRPVFTHLRLRWGLLHGPGDTLAVTPPCDPVDWTGTLRTDRGLVIVRRTIAFERPLDHVIFPRLNAQTVAFVSHTGCHYDGLLITIIERPEDIAAAPAAPNRLHIDTAAWQGEFAVAELPGLRDLIEVDDQGHRLELTGFRLTDVAVCPKGFLSGRYRLAEGAEPDSTGAVMTGELAGAWSDLTGRLAGFLRGGYGFDDTGAPVFHAKYIDRRGRFMGRLHGTWEAGAAPDQLAAFSGVWIGRSGAPAGLLGGTAHPVEGNPGGFFTGRWTMTCDDQAEAQLQ